MYIPEDSELTRMVLEEAHKSHITIHPSSSKMYQDLKNNFWWSRMKKEVVEYAPGYIVCQLIRIKHHNPSEMGKYINGFLSRITL